MNTTTLLALIEGLKLIEAIAEKAAPGALDAAKSVVKSLINMHDGKVSAKDVLAELDAMRAKLAANDAAALAALDAKFPR
jgi:hypothetical protein